MKYIQLPLGMVSTNCYILYNKEKEALLVDPSANPDVIIDKLEELELQPLAILLTHTHFDHIGAVSALVKKFNILFYVHKKEVSWLKDGNKNGSYKFGLGNITVEEEPTILEMGTMQIGSYQFDVLYTPGHSPGSVSYYFKEDKVVFSGDALFQLSIGRTDLLMGSFERLEKSIKEELYALPDNTIVASGHGPLTEVGYEKKNNPFVTGE